MNITRKCVEIQVARGAYNQPSEALDRDLASVFVRDYACWGFSLEVFRV